MSCEHDWYNATKIGDAEPVDMCRLCGAKSNDPAVEFQRAWDYSVNNLDAIRMIERGSVWRVHALPPTPLRPMGREDYGMMEARVIELRAKRIGNLDPLWVIEARYADGGDWTEVTTGRMIY